MLKSGVYQQAEHHMSYMMGYLAKFYQTAVDSLGVTVCTGKQHYPRTATNTARKQRRHLQALLVAEHCLIQAGPCAQEVHRLVRDRCYDNTMAEAALQHIQEYCTVPDIQTAIQAARMSLKQLHTQVARDNYKIYCRKIQHMYRTNRKLAHRVIKKQHHPTPHRTPYVLHPHDHKVCQTAEDITQAFADYYRQHFGQKPSTTHEQAPWEDPGLADHFTLLHRTMATHDIPAQLADGQALRTKMRFLPKGKAPGPDGIPNEILQLMDHSTVQHMAYTRALHVCTTWWATHIKGHSP